MTGTSETRAHHPLLGKRGAFEGVARRHGRRRNPARMTPRSSLRPPTNQLRHSPQRWVEKCGRSIKGSETPQPDRGPRQHLPAADRHLRSGPTRCDQGCAGTSARASRRHFATPTPRTTTSRSTKQRDTRPRAMGSMDRAGSSDLRTPALAMGTGKMSASECVQELLERIAAGVGVDARVELQDDAERARLARQISCRTAATRHERKSRHARRQS
jgi:hypothetical protein